MILDDFSNNNILSIESYSSGDSNVYNYINLETNTTKAGYVTWSAQSPISADSFYVSIVYDSDLITSDTDYPSGIPYSSRSDLASIVDWVNHNTTLNDKGFKARLLKDPVSIFRQDPVSTPYTVDYAVQFYTDGVLDLKKFSINLIYSSSFLGIYLLMEEGLLKDSFIVGFKEIFSTFTLMPYGDNQLFSAKDAQSRSMYGTKIYTLKNYEYISSNSTSKQDVLNNKLEDTKDPKSRMVMHTMFDNNYNIADTIEVRLAFMNVSQTNTFKEGGVWLSWDEHEDGYRYKQFLVTGLRHSQDASYTSLTLMEKI